MVPDDTGWQLWSAIGAAFTAMGSGFLYLLGRITGLSDSVNADRVYASRNFVEKEDLAGLEQRMVGRQTEMMDEIRGIRTRVHDIANHVAGMRPS